MLRTFVQDCLVLFPSIQCFMGSAPVGVQCPLTSSLGEFPGYWDWFWYPGFLPVLVSFPSPSISRCFPFTLLHLPLDFIRLFFTVAVSAPHHQPSSLFQTGTMVIGYPKRLRYDGGGVLILLLILFRHTINDRIIIIIIIII